MYEDVRTVTNFAATVMVLGFFCNHVPHLLAGSSSKIQLFHGTSQEITRKALKEGLKPQKVEESEFPCIYLAYNPLHAARYGDTIIKVSLPKEEMGYLRETLPGYMKSVYTIEPKFLGLWGKVISIEGEPPDQIATIRKVDGTVVSGNTRRVER